MRDEMGLYNDAESLVEPSPLFDALRSGVRQHDGSVLVDKGDGTGTRTVFDADGKVVSVEQLTGLPIVEPAEELEPDVDRYVIAEQARRTAYDEFMAAGSHTLARIDQANRAGSDAFLAALEAS